MTSALIPPVILPRPATGSQPCGRHGAPGTLPLAASPGQVPVLTADVVYGLGLIDASGRSPTGRSRARWAGAAATG